MKSRKRRWGIWLAIIFLITIISLLALNACGGEKEKGRATIKVQKQNIVDKALAVGSIEPVNEIDVKSKVSGVVGRLFADVGDFVNAGDLLLEVKPDPTPQELAQAKRDVEMSEIELETLGKELKRNDQLKSQGMISDHDHEVLIRQYDEAKLKHQICLERLDLIEKGHVKIDNTKIEAVVKSPLTGYILEKHVNLGDPVVPLTSYQPGTALMRIADMKELLFKGTVDEIDVGKIHEGLECDIQVGAIPGESISGKVILISLKAKKEDNTTVFPVEIKINPTKNVVPRAGYSANAHVIIARRDSVLAVPERVVTFRNDSAFVRLPTGEEGSEERYIKTGLSDAIQIEIVEGLKEGDEVLEKEVKDIT